MVEIYKLTLFVIYVTVSINNDNNNGNKKNKNKGNSGKNLAQIPKQEPKGTVNPVDQISSDPLCSQVLAKAVF